MLYFACCSHWLLLLKRIGLNLLEFYWHINPGEKGDGEPVDYIRIDLLGFESDCRGQSFF